ncbi:MAG: aminoacyl-tRNA hydrolase [Planctomycetales bacterium 12-60-4]|nr:MAG: aminoacyl-tRNA hydrolase [Planctomycetales bacterium 12-60-4]
MKFIVGLGNPGSKYEGTRHNVGFEVGFELARRWQIDRPRQRFEAEIAEGTWGGEKVLLVWPQTYMNLSGRSIGQLLKFHQSDVSQLLVICDDLNLKLGQLRLRGSGSAGGQKGLLSIIQVLGTENIPRLRLGIDRPPPGDDVVNYVLAKFRKEELETVDAVVRRAAAGVEKWVTLGLNAAMNEVNPAEPPKSSPAPRNRKTSQSTPAEPKPLANNELRTNEAGKPVSDPE